ncbi:polymorphic toxin-type HINT domain-containing protein [Streptomyces kanamyceticus]|uniref:TreTu family toxin n=1 Tax=Streptomyces kanamyceticus TaxID=1967 RepID=UPI0006E25B13|nr:polymorphic toxin-type HINT domain-containing protein [Streptomyces kanamyceticus]
MSLALSAVLVGTLLQAAAAPTAVAEGSNLPGLPKSERPVAGKNDPKAEPRILSKGPRTPSRTPKKSWPKGGTADVILPDSSAKGADKFLAAKGQPIGVALARTARGKKAEGTAPHRIETRVLDRTRAERAGVQGLLFALTPTEAPQTEPKSMSRTARAADAAVAVTVDYTDFAEAFGGGYASRLRLVELPACAVTTPTKDTCRTGKPVAAENNTEKRTLTADSVHLKSGGATVLAAAADTEGIKGDYKATALSASSAWSTDLNTGDFSWSYEMPVPEVPGSLSPSVGLSYSSGSIDGRTGGTNNQGSWVGDGFDLWPGSIERRYKSCADDGEKNSDGSKPGDQCWAYDNATLTFNGKGGELVSAGNDEFKLKSDDGTKIKRLRSTDRGNGDNDGEYWRVTTPDGTRYYFGYNRLPGWAEGKDATNSTWTTPVFGNNSGEECHKDTFAASWCQQAWRWNLDYVVDPHGNAISYHYAKESNSYGRNLKAEDDTPYTRGGYLKRIDYGLKSSSMFSKPQAQVVFDNAERCLPKDGVTCAADSIDDKSFYWYDTPWDLNCKAGTKCDEGRLGPSFWTRKRLTDVTTKVLKADGTYAEVDSWKLAHRWGMADTDYQLLLDSIQHTGHSASPAVTLPKTTFAYTQHANRLDKIGDGYAPFIKARLSDVADEYGGQVTANYSDPVCDFDKLPTPQSNTTRCFPQYIGGDSTTDPERHWFNKYVTTSVTSSDRTGGAPDQVTKYEYLGDAAWHFDDDDGLTKEKHKTWSQWRGYGHVRVKTGGEGGADAMKSQEERYFLRGMDGDRKDSSGGTKSVSVPLGEGEGDAITDHESAAGFEYKAVAFDKPGGKVLTKSVNRPWRHETAKKERSWGTVTANLTGTGSTKEWTSLDNGVGSKWRTTSSTTTLDTVAGRATQVDDRGDGSTADDNQCTRTTFATNTADNILNMPSRVETVAKACDTAVDRTKDVISDTRTAYDGGVYGAAPTKGDATTTATLKSHNGTKATYLESGASYDGYGRELTTTDLTADVTAEEGKDPVRAARKDGRTTTTSYTPATGRPTQTKVTTPPATLLDPATAQTTTTELDAVSGLPVKQTDTNGNVTAYAHDALGRSAKVWLANRETSQTPNYEFVYAVTEGKPSTVATKTLDNSGGQITSYALYDGFLRERQTQAPGPESGRILTDVFYDERGLATKTFAPYYTTGAPTTTLFEPNDIRTVETQNRTTYDGLGREVENQQLGAHVDGAKVLNTTTTVYGGDRATVIPPEGGTATTTLTDARGNTTELRQHHERKADAAYDTTLYTHTPRGELSKVTDPAGNSWTYTYDQLGRQTETTDPDRGKSISDYDDRGQLTTSTDARKVTLVNVYDNLGRKTELREGTDSGPLRAKWVYDTVTGAKGQLAESTRYIGDDAYTSKVTAYDKLYRATKTAVVIPAKEGSLQGAYQSGTTYKPSGLTATVSYSAAGSLPAGSFNYDYEDKTLRPISVFGQGMTSSTKYSYTGKPLQYDLGLTGNAKITRVTNTYEAGTQRLATSRVDRTDQVGVDRHVTYGYDEVGNVRSMADVSRTGTDNQCFTYDYLARLTEAWTQNTATCATDPAGDKVGGPAPYWHSYTYDKVGNRQTETLHNPAGDSTKDTKRTYTYPTPGSSQPHTLTDVSTSGPTGTSKSIFEYDDTGNTITRKVSGDGQKLTWDAEGHLAKVTEADKVTEYVYDADGNRLIGRTDADTTLYLGHTELTLAKGATKAKATRYITLGGSHQAIRNDDGTFDFTIADHHGTGQLAINAADLALSQKRTLPFGGPRGDAPKEWPGTKGFVGGTDDTKATGLTHLGAREYDPATGRFISVDPLMDPTDPQQMQGYTYGNNNPATLSDPDGLRPMGACDHGGPCNVGSKKKPKWETWTYTSRGSWSWGWSASSTSRWTSGNYRYSSTSWLHYNRNSGYSLSNSGVSKIRKPEPKRVAAPDSSIYGMGTNPNWKHHDNAAPAPKQDLSFLCSPSDSKLKCDLRQSSYRTSELISMVAGARAAAGVKGSKGLRNPGGCTCFVAGTPVLMANDTHKDIKDVEVGDKVLATDPETGKTTARKVTNKIVTDKDREFVDLTISAKDGTGSLTATGEHPFWVPSLKLWLEANDLEAGITLRTDKGETVKVRFVRHYQERQRTYNLTVEGVHTYYVVAGETPVLVHNSGGHTPDDGMVTVGRWMSGAEHQAMMETGMVQRGGGGFTYVVYPASRDAYISARPGSVYAEFDVPKSSLIPGGRSGDFKMSDSDTIFARLAQKKGNPVPQLPEAKNIKLGGWGCP